MKVLGMAVVLLVLLTFVGPWRDHHPSRREPRLPRLFNDVHPDLQPPASGPGHGDQFRGPGHPAANAIDGAVNTSWQTNAPDNGIGQSLTIRLAAVSNLDEIGFLNGDQDTPRPT